MTGPRKAAVLLLTMQSLDKNLPSEVLKQFTNERIRLGIVREIGQIAQGTISISVEERAQIIDDFNKMIDQHGLYGGWGNAEELLDPLLTGDSFTRERKEQQLRDILGTSPFSFLKEMEANDIWGYIQDEHPQTIALVLVCLPAEKAAALLQQISPPKARNDVARRIATMERVMPDALNEVQEAIKAKMEFITGHQDAIGSGPNKLAQILVRIDGDMQESILEDIRQKDMANAERVVENMLTFNDIIYISESDMRRFVITALQASGDLENTLPIALKGAPEAVTDKFMSNMGKRNRGAVEDVVRILGGVSRRDIEAARATIVEVIRQLEQAGSITISRDYEEEELIE